MLKYNKKNQLGGKNSTYVHHKLFKRDIVGANGGGNIVTIYDNPKKCNKKIEHDFFLVFYLFYTMRDKNSHIDSLINIYLKHKC
jgi:hypothetical protein